MYTLFILPPPKLEKMLKIANTKISTHFYNTTFTNTYYRVRSRPVNDNNRKVFIPGTGEIHEYEVPPHSTLVLPFEGEHRDIESLCQELSLFAERSPIHCTMLGLGDHDGSPYTFFIKLSMEAERLKLQCELQSFVDERFSLLQKIDSYRPHFTLLYDDVDESIPPRARALLDENIFRGELLIEGFSLWCHEEGQDWREVRWFQFCG